jgi:hypothetical protein
LTSLTSSKVKFEWHSSHQQAFDKIKKVIGTEVLLCYPDFSKRFPFHLYILMHQIIRWGQSSCRIKSKATIAFYSRKLNTAQKLYTNTERSTELLSVIETCKEYKNILLGYPIIVFTDHNNNTFNSLKASDLVLRWFVLVEEYGVSFEYLPGKKLKNVAVVADTLFCLDIDSLKIQEEEMLTLLSGSENNSISDTKSTTPIHTALIFKEQAKVKKPGFREKGLAHPNLITQYNILKGMIFFATKKRSTFLNH